MVCEVSERLLSSLAENNWHLKPNVLDGVCHLVHVLEIHQHSLLRLSRLRLSEKTESKSIPRRLIQSVLSSGSGWYPTLLYSLAWGL